MNDKKSNPDDIFASFPLFLAILALALAALTTFSYFIGLNTGLEFLQLVSAVEVPASLALSAILAYLYFRQADLMKGQQKLMELDYTPKLSLGEMRIDEREMGEEKVRSINESDIDINLESSNDHTIENLSIPMSNIGEGVATDLRLDLTVESVEPEFEETRRYSALQRPLESQDSHDYGYVRAGRRRRPIAGHHHNHLTSSAHKDFKAIVTFRFSTNHEETEFVFLPFSCIIALLDRQNVERARLQIDISYGDTIQNEYTFRIMTISFDVSNSEDLSDVLRYGEMSYPDYVEEKMTGDCTPTISEVNSWISSEVNRND